MATKVPMKFYKVGTEGAYNLLPVYNEKDMLRQGMIAANDLSEIQADITKYSAKTDSWSQNYVKNLQAGIIKLQSGESPYALDSKGVLTTTESLAKQADIQTKLASGNYTNLGTAEAPMIVPKGTPSPEEANKAYQATQPTPTYQTTATPPPTLGAGTTGTKKEVSGFPQSSNEHEKWIAMGRTFENGKWYEPSAGAGAGGVGGTGTPPGGTGGTPGGAGTLPGDTGGGAGGDTGAGGTTTIPTLSFDLGDVLSGQFNTDDLMNIFSSPITDGDIQKLLDENLKLRDQFLNSLNPTDAEIQLKSDLADIRNEIQVAQLDYRKGVADIQQGLVSTRVMAGQEQALYTQSQLGIQTLAIQESNLLSRLGLEQEAREASSNVIGATLGFNDSDLNRMMTMQNTIYQQKMDLFNVMSQFSVRAQNTLNIVLDGLVGIDAGDLDSKTITQLQSLTQSAGIPWSVVQQAMKVKKDEYEYNRYMDDLDRQLMEEKLNGSDGLDFTDDQKRKLEQAGIDWRDPVGRQKALDFLYKEGPENVEEMMTQYKDLVQQYKDNNFSKEDAESMVRSENGIKKDEDIPGPYQDVIDEIYDGKKVVKNASYWDRFKNWLYSPVETK